LSTNFYDIKLYLMSENLNNQREEVKATSEVKKEKMSIADEILKQIAEKTGKNLDLAELETKKVQEKVKKTETSTNETKEAKKEVVDTNQEAETVKITTKKEKTVETNTNEVSKNEDLVSQMPEHEEDDDHVSEGVDYSNHSKIELVQNLRNLIQDSDVDSSKSEIENIKQAFYKLHNAELKKLQDDFEKKNAELPEEEKLIFEVPVDELELEVKELLRKYKAEKAEQFRKLEKEKEENLSKKNEIIEKIKTLINKEEAFNETFNEFRSLQQEWREIGIVPQNSVKELWENYNLSVENFYAYVKINKELRDLDLKKNLEIKSKLCDEAEELLIDSDVINAFKLLQDLHDLWREAGPVPPEKKDELWERFKRATTQINKNHQDYFEKLKEEQNNNLKAKTLICDKVDEIVGLDLSNSKDWDDKSKEIIELQKIWRLIGFAPKKENNAIYQRFRESCDAFFNKKRDHFEGLKGEQNNNLQSKLDLCVQAEALIESTEWKKTSDEYIALQRRWKEIGPVPRKQSDLIWKRFRAACDSFFNKKTEYFKNIDQVQDVNLKLKLDLIEKIKNFEEQESAELNIQTLKDLQNEWMQIGHVPFNKKDELITEFRKVIDAKFENFNMNLRERSNLKFKNKVEQLTTGGPGKMKAEREKLVTLLQKINSDITTLENNIGFFANTKNADALINDVKSKIVSTKKKAEEIQQKIKMIDNA